MEKGAEQDSTYICSTCTGRIGALSQPEKRLLIDKLYLADRSEDAQFIEKCVTGGNSSTSEVPLLKKRTVAIKIRKR